MGRVRLEGQQGVSYDGKEVVMGATCRVLYMFYVGLAACMHVGVLQVAGNIS